MSTDDRRPQRPGGGRDGHGFRRDGPPGGRDRRPKEDPTHRRAQEIAKNTGLPYESARQVAAGRADLNDLLKRMAFRDEVQALITRHGLNRALATQVVLGQADLAQVLSRRRIEEHLAGNRERAVLEEHQASGKELTLGLHGHKSMRVVVREVDRYEIVVTEVETKAEHRIHKLQIKYAYAPDDHKRVRKGMDYDKARREQQIDPIARPQDRYACSDRRLGVALDKKLHVTAVTLEGECFTGEIAWVARYEFGLRTRSGGEVVVFRHALVELREPG